MKIFISCGLLEHERVIGDWCYDHLTRNRHEVYWYGRAYRTKPPVRTVKEEIRNADLFIAILHRRYLMAPDKYASSPSVHQEVGMRWAIKEEGIMPFVEKGAHPGMLEQMTQVIPFDRENPEIISDYISQIETQPPEPIPDWLKILGAVAVGSFLTYLFSKLSRR